MLRTWARDTWLSFHTIIIHDWEPFFYLFTRREESYMDIDEVGHNGRLDIYTRGTIGLEFVRSRDDRLFEALFSR